VLLNPSVTLAVHRYGADQEAWQQLAELCLQQRQYRQAAFCLEELILASPLNYMYSEKYAEVREGLGRMLGLGWWVENTRAAVDRVASFGKHTLCTAVPLSQYHVTVYRFCTPSETMTALSWHAGILLKP